MTYSDFQRFLEQAPRFIKAYNHLVQKRVQLKPSDADTTWIHDYDNLISHCIGKGTVDDPYRVNTIPISDYLRVLTLFYIHRKPNALITIGGIWFKIYRKGVKGFYIVINNEGNITKRFLYNQLFSVIPDSQASK